MNPSSAAFTAEIYGEVLKDIDGNEYFEPNEICLWIGESFVSVPLSVFDSMSDDMINVVNGKALGNFKKENEPDYL